MRGKGITYDTGFISAGVNLHEPFNPDRVKREMRIIRDDLHCNAVRITGGDPERLEIAASHAAAAGLEVWFSPFTNELTTDELLDLLVDCAERAERLRQQRAEVVFVTGAELSLFTAGFLPGATSTDRVNLLLTGHPKLGELLGKLRVRLNRFLGPAVEQVRQRFGGKVTYASIQFEGVDWTPFDFLSVDSYRTAEIAGQYRAGIHALVAQGKPVAITEFGCATYLGAADRGARGGMIVEWDGAKAIALDGDYTRDENEQARYLRELLDIFDAEGVDTAFAYTFASYHLPHRADPHQDLDKASFGVVKVLEDRRGLTYPDMPWEPKAAFAALADYYGG